MSLTKYLNKLYKFQDKIMLCFRRNSKDYWNDRCLFLSEEYSPIKPYNHRSILKNEIVIEFDDDDSFKNKKHAEYIVRRLKKDGISASMWHSGNKSYHVHCLVRVNECNNLPLLKNTFMRHYCEGIPLCDLRLAENNHLVRAEYGIHEKTYHTKIPILSCRNYFKLHNIPKKIWIDYSNRMNTVLQRKTTMMINDLTTLPLIKAFLNNKTVRDTNDGRSRLLFVLIQVLKHKYKKLDNGKEELQKFMWNWYKYSSGLKLSKSKVYNQVTYGWNRDYSIGVNYIYRVAEDIGFDLDSLKKD